MSPHLSLRSLKWWSALNFVRFCKAPARVSKFLNSSKINNLDFINCDFRIRLFAVIWFAAPTGNYGVSFLGRSWHLLTISGPSWQAQPLQHIPRGRLTHFYSGGALVRAPVCLRPSACSRLARPVVAAGCVLVCHAHLFPLNARQQKLTALRGLFGL